PTRSVTTRIHNSLLRIPHVPLPGLQLASGMDSGAGDTRHPPDIHLPRTESLKGGSASARHRLEQPARKLVDATPPSRACRVHKLRKDPSPRRTAPATCSLGGPAPGAPATRCPAVRRVTGPRPADRRP